MKALKRNISLIGFLTAMALVFTSYYFQHALSFRPCLLCTIQRGVFIALAMVFFLAFAHQYFRGPARGYSFITALLSILGAAAASRQLWLQSLPPQPNELCVPGISYLFHQLPFLDAVKMIYTASQECARVEWVFWNLSMAGWALIFFVILFFVSIVMGVYRR
jgi:protein dithiol:quinone oxidoreductase